MLDVNAGIPLADEPAILRQTIELVQSITDVPLSIDSSIVEALEAGLSVYQGKALVNSVTGEDEQMERVLPLVAKYGAAVVAISNDETGISRGSRRPLRGGAEDRLARRRLRHPARGHRRRPARDADRRDGHRGPAGVPARPAAAGRAEGQLDLRRLERQLRAAEPAGLNAAFLPMAIASGLTSAITSPLHAEVRHAIWAADVMNGNDEHCAAWIARNGDSGEAAQTGRRGGRDGRRRAAGGVNAAAAPTHARRLHALRAARPLRSGHDRARRGAAARGRHRLRLRRPRHLRPLPGRGERGRAREARDHLRRDSPVADRRGRSALRGRQGPRGRPPPRLHRATSRASS